MSKYLRLQAKVANPVLKQLGIVNKPKELDTPLQAWFFVDYANAPFKKKAVFDVILNTDATQIKGISTKITLVTILDQFGHSLPAIPEGYNTICCFSFTPTIPSAIRKLPNLSTWDAVPNTVVIANKQDINIGLSNQKIASSLHFNAQYIKRIIASKGPQLQPKVNIISLVATDLNVNDQEAADNINFLIETGVLQEKDGILV
jgi:hypothetical protein